MNHSESSLNVCLQSWNDFTCLIFLIQVKRLPKLSKLGH